MKNSVKCIAQTINLAQTSKSSFARSSQVQKLINADVTIPCPESIGHPYKTSCRPVPVRICTRLDMRRTLPPKVCACPQKLPPETLGKRITRWFKNLTKSLIAGSLVYWTSAEGFWGDGQDAEDLYLRIISTVAPDEISLPHLENLKHNFLDTYNRSVLRLMGLISWLPIKIEEKINEFFFPCDDGKSGGIENKKKRGLK